MARVLSKNKVWRSVGSGIKKRARMIVDAGVAWKWLGEGLIANLEYRILSPLYAVQSPN